jgi:tRNA(Ile2) C34 agmatinyltransferase TiaS
MQGETPEEIKQRAKQLLKMREFDAVMRGADPERVLRLNPDGTLAQWWELTCPRCGRRYKSTLVSSLHCDKCAD